MDKSNVEKKIEAQREQFKAQTKQTDQAFDALIKSYPDPQRPCPT